jgi:hypothetical protein
VDHLFPRILILTARDTYNETFGNIDIDGRLAYRSQLPSCTTPTVFQSIRRGASAQQ